MTKSEFKKIVQDGISRGRAFMAVKILEVGSPYPIVVITPREIVKSKVNGYMRSTNDNLIFHDTGNYIEDVIVTSNLNDLNWFVY